MKGRAKLKPRLPQSLVVSTQDNEPRPSTSSLSTMNADKETSYEQVTTCNKAVQVNPKTADRYTYCSIKKRKTAKPFQEEEQEFIMEVDIEDALPSTQGSTACSEISQTSSETFVNKEKQGRIMLELIERKPHVYIDCLEIEIEKPSNPVSQSLTWSQYKNANTLNYLLATTPDGLISFVSAGFGGRISDVNIVESSGFLDQLPPNCTILADREFKHIDTILNKIHIKLLRPPSVSKDTKLSKQEAIRSKVIASLRIHVERVIRRVRLFKLLKPHSVVNNKLIQYVDETIIVACGLLITYKIL